MNEVIKDIEENKRLVALALAEYTDDESLSPYKKRILIAVGEGKLDTLNLVLRFIHDHLNEEMNKITCHECNKPCKKSEMSIFNYCSDKCRTRHEDEMDEVHVDELKKEIEYKMNAHIELNAVNPMKYSQGVIDTCKELLAINKELEHFSKVFLDGKATLKVNELPAKYNKKRD